MRAWKTATLIFCLGLLVFLPGCQEKSEPPDILPNIEQELKATGLIPEIKADPFTDYFNQKWPGFVWMSTKYIFNAVNVADTVIFSVKYFPLEDPERQKGEPPNADEVIGEIVWNAAWEFHPTTIGVAHEKPDGSIDTYDFLNNAKVIREDNPQNWRKYISYFSSNVACLFPDDDSTQTYKVIGQPANATLREMVDAWNKQWTGQVRVVANDFLTEAGEVKAIKYRVMLGFKTPSSSAEQWFYLQKINGILGQIVYGTYKNFSPQSFVMLVSYPDGSYYAYFPKGVKPGEVSFQDAILEQPKETVIAEWTRYFIAKQSLLGQ